MRLLRLICLTFALGFVGAHMSAAADWPALTGRVVDNAGLMSAAGRKALEAELAAFEQKSSDQIVVATIPSLEGAALEDYANGLFRHWGLGQAQENNGVLLLIARDDRKMRIEVGYGLEGALTDALSKVIIESALIPAFRAGDFEKGITDGVRDIIAVLSGDAAELESRAKRNSDRSGSEDSWIFYAFAGVFLFIFVRSTLFPILARRFGTEISRGRYRWLGMIYDFNRVHGPPRHGDGGWSGGSGWSGGGGWSDGGSSGGGFSGGGGYSGGGGSSGSW